MEARREFRGEDKRTWRGSKTGSIKPADPSETSTGFGIERHISGNGIPKTPIGEILRREVREMLSERQAGEQ